MKAKQPHPLFEFALFGILFASPLLRIRFCKGGADVTSHMQPPRKSLTRMLVDHYNQHPDEQVVLGAPD
jgi:hypothetical protein